jgi:hypothetical protein
MVPLSCDGAGFSIFWLGPCDGAGFSIFWLGPCDGAGFSIFWLESSFFLPKISILSNATMFFGSIRKTLSKQFFALS